MKKIVSLILAVALIAALAISASADVVVHEQNAWEAQNQIQHGGTFEAYLNSEGDWFWTERGFLGETGSVITWTDENGVEQKTFVPGLFQNGVDYVKKNVAAGSQMVKITNAPADMQLSWTKCSEAITVKEAQALCTPENNIKNLTVFYQRNVSTAGGTFDVRLWPCNPAKLKNQSVIVLYRSNADGVWTVLANEFGTRDALNVQLPAGDGAFAVCLGW